MGQFMRQIGIVIGLTVILTFPVTVVSGAGSQKHSDHVVSSTAAGTKKAVAANGHAHGAWPSSAPARNAARPDKR
jgi:hypothetical protein